MTETGSSAGDAKEPIREDDSQVDGTNDLPADVYLKPGTFSLYPRFDPATVREIVERLGQPWDENHYLNELKQHERVRRHVGFVYTAGILFFLAMTVATLTTADRTAGDDLSNDDIFFIYAPRVAFLIGVYLLVKIFWDMSIANANARFFRRIGEAIQPAWEADRDRSLTIEVLYVLNKLGAASRALFLALQGSRRAWKSPPMVADRATTLAAVLIDFDIPNDLHLKNSTSLASLHRFLQDSAAVVAIGREDLLPRVREMYRELAARSGQDKDKQKRDATYVNAMQDRSRWDVARDFWYPLAPWLSLLVATAALIISIRR